MKKYIITIVDLRTGEYQINTVDENKFIDYCEKNIGAANDVVHASNYSKNGFEQCGIVKSKPLKFSILCYTPEN